ncbi:chorismate synthase [Chloroflexota bacterium]
MGRFRFLTAGESHGKGLVAVAEGMVADLPVEEHYINKELKRRQQGYGRGRRMKIEDDKVEIIAGVRFGLTTGTPIALFITNRDWENWQRELSVSPVDREVEPVTCPRPGHADLAGVTKYGLEDIRPIIERASARETAARVAAGAIARRFLEEFGIAIHSYTVAIGRHHWEPPKVSSMNWGQVEISPVRCANAKVEEAMVAAIDEAKADGDTLGGVFEVIAAGIPIGLGSHVSWDRRLDGRIARGIMSINAVKGVEIGAAFASAGLRGSQAHDVIEPNPRGKAKGPPWRHATNRAGGIEGGVSNGEDIVVRAAVKPIATLARPLPSINLRGGRKEKAHYERSDICVVPAAGVIGEAMVAVVLADACLEKFGGDNLKETLQNYRSYSSNIS